MFEKCTAFFTKQQYLIPTKIMLGKLVSSVLKTYSVPKYMDNKKYVFFESLVERECPKSTMELKFPPHCQVKIVNSVFTITCLREYVHNGRRLQCTAKFAPDCTSIEVLGHAIELNITLAPNQKNIEGIVFLLENLKFCKGIQKENVKLQSAVTHTWSLIYDEKQCDERICSKTCEKIISWNSKNDFCYNCAQLVRKALKRNKEQEDPLSQDQITAPKIRCSDSNFESNEITNEENKK